MSTNRCSNPRSFKGMPIRCKRCPGCLRVKAWIKSSLALLELHGSDRTWFVTLTFEKTPPTEKEGYAHVQKWLKLVRQKLDRKKGERIRFVAVAEFGSKTARLHYHLLLFVSGGVVYRDIYAWSHGHFKYKLADRRAVRYVVKYLTKDGVKYRASQKMGQEEYARIQAHSLTRACLDAFPGAKISKIRIKGQEIARPKGPASSEEVGESEARREFLEDFMKRNRIRPDLSGPNCPAEFDEPAPD